MRSLSCFGHASVRDVSNVSGRSLRSLLMATRPTLHTDALNTALNKAWKENEKNVQQLNKVEKVANAQQETIKSLHKQVRAFVARAPMCSSSNTLLVITARTYQVQSITTTLTAQAAIIQTHHAGASTSTLAATTPPPTTTAAATAQQTGDEQDDVPVEVVQEQLLRQQLQLLQVMHEQLVQQQQWMQEQLAQHQQSMQQAIQQAVQQSMQQSMQIMQEQVVVGVKRKLDTMLGDDGERGAQRARHDSNDGVSEAWRDAVIPPHSLITSFTHHHLHLYIVLCRCPSNAHATYGETLVSPHKHPHSSTTSITSTIAS